MQPRVVKNSQNLQLVHILPDYRRAPKRINKPKETQQIQKRQQKIGHITTQNAKMMCPIVFITERRKCMGKGEKDDTKMKLDLKFSIRHFNFCNFFKIGLRIISKNIDFLKLVC